MSTTTRFCGEIRKLLCGYPLLSVAMLPPTQQKVNPDQTLQSVASDHGLQSLSLIQQFLTN